MRIHHDSDMSTPDHEIARLWPGDSLKYRIAVVQGVRAGVIVREAGAPIDVMREVRAIFAAKTLPVAQRRINDGLSFASRQQLRLALARRYA